MCAQGAALILGAITLTHSPVATSRATCARLRCGNQVYDSTSGMRASVVCCFLQRAIAMPSPIASSNLAPHRYASRRAWRLRIVPGLLAGLLAAPALQAGAAAQPVPSTL